MSKENSQTPSSINQISNYDSDFLGDPKCPYCHGLGYVRQDLPINHPDFGKLQICSCRENQITTQVKEHLYKLSHLEELSHLTFDNFNPRGRFGILPRQADSLEQAYNQAQHFSRTLTGWLVLQGNYGCGKTHLAAAVANFAVSIGIPTLFITVPDLLDMLRFAYNDPDATFERRFEEIRSSELLIIDDFGTQNATAWAQEKLFQIINYRYINHLPLLVTTNLSDQDIDERIRSRLRDPDIVTHVIITAPDYRNPTGDMGFQDISAMDLSHHLNFSNFSLRETEKIPKSDLQSLKKAFQGSVSYSENPRGWIVILGDHATGKTHLAAAIANAQIDNEYPPIFITAIDLLDHLRATFNPNSTITLDRQFEKVRKARLLILDDLRTQAASPWAREKLYQLFDHRYMAELSTVITSSDSLEEMDPRLRSRILDRRLCKIFAITVPSFTG